MDEYIQKLIEEANRAIQSVKFEIEVDQQYLSQHLLRKANKLIYNALDYQVNDIKASELGEIFKLNVLTDRIRQEPSSVSNCIMIYTYLYNILNIHKNTLIKLADIGFTAISTTSITNLLERYQYIFNYFNINSNSNNQQVSDEQLSETDDHNQFFDTDDALLQFASENTGNYNTLFFENDDAI